jgi:hypothetical protein
VTRFSARYALIIGILLGIAQLPLVYGRIATQRDECPGNEALLDLAAIDPLATLVESGERATRIDAGRLTGTREPRSADESPMIFSVLRTFGLPNRLLQPASALPGRREPDQVKTAVLSTEHGDLPVQYAFERGGRVVRITAYFMVHRGAGIRSPLWTRLGEGSTALFDGTWPITLFAISGVERTRDLDRSIARMDEWLIGAWAHYQRVCSP